MMGLKSSIASALIKSTNQPLQIRIGWGVLASGIILRIYFFLFNPAQFTFDESVIYRLITKSSTLQILFPQKGCVIPGNHYPFGFLAVVKFVASFVGRQEFILRFLPFMSGITGLILFNKLKDIFLAPQAGLVALFLMATNWWLIYYGMNIKPYTCDVLVTVILLFVFYDLRIKGKIGIGKLVLFASAGSLCVWFSNPSIFLLISGAFVLGLYEFGHKNGRRINKRLFLIFFSWGLSFFFNYWIRLRVYTFDPGLIGAWSNLLFYGKGVFSSIFSVWELLLRMFSNPLGLIPLLGIFFLAEGAFWFYHNQRFNFMILFLPIVLALGAAMINQYIFIDRLLLFLMPVFCLFIGQGCEFVYSKAKTLKLKAGIYILLVICLFKPLLLLKAKIATDVNSDSFKARMEFVLKSYKEGDVIYIASGMVSMFEYYQGFLQIDADRYILAGLDEDYHKSIEELQKIDKYKRVWFFYNHLSNNQARFVQYHLEKIGQKMMERAGHDALNMYEIRVPDPEL